MRLERTVLQLAVQAICAAGALILLSHWPWQVAAGRSLQPAPNLKWPIVTQRPPTHIIGGNPSDPCKWPWHVALLKTDGSFLCGATLIYRNWVLTAGHCLYGKPPDIPIYAALGAHNLSANDEHQLIPVTTIKIHAGYDPNEYGVNDLALLELAEPANLSHPCIEAIALAQSTFDPVFTGNCWMVGWGMNCSLRRRRLQRGSFGGPGDRHNEPELSEAMVEITLLQSNHLFIQRLHLRTRELHKLLRWGQRQPSAVLRRDLRRRVMGPSRNPIVGFWQLQGLSVRVHEGLQLHVLDSQECRHRKYQRSRRNDDYWPSLDRRYEDSVLCREDSVLCRGHVLSICSKD